MSIANATTTVATDLSALPLYALVVGALVAVVFIGIHCTKEQVSRLR